MEDFSARLKEAMARKGINASELARQSGVGKNLISYYINGKYQAKQDKVYMLAKALDVDPGWLITGVEPEAEYNIPIFGSDNDKFVMLLKAMPYEDYKTFLDILRRAEKKLREEGVKL